MSKTKIKNKKAFVEIYNDVTTYPTIKSIEEALGVSERTVRRNAEMCRKAGVELVDRSGRDEHTEITPESLQAQFDFFKDNELLNQESIDALDEVIANDSINQAITKQKNQDKMRMLQKQLREMSRPLAAIGEYQEELIKLLKANSPKSSIKVHKHKDGTPVGIVHISDVHFNEQVSLPDNEYNWEMASARIKHHIARAKVLFKADGVSNVLVALTGDLLNSDRRLDELLINATNRSQASFLAFEILRQALLDLNKDFNVNVASVCGNESRLGKEYGNAYPLVTDNFDYTIFNMLYQNLDSDGIRFNINDDPSECVVDVNDQHVLLMHGHVGVKNATQLTTSVETTRGRYAARNVNIRLVLLGHIHQAYVSEWFSRSGSPVGANDYSDKGLGLTGRASQNLHTVWNTGKIDSFKIDLQTVNRNDGYDITEALKTYNSKSKSKLNEGETIFRVTI